MNEGRIFRILFHLMENDRATAPELAHELGVSVRTIYRDIDVKSISPPHAKTDGRLRVRPFFKHLTSN